MYGKLQDAESGKIGMEGFVRFGLELAGGDEALSATPEHTALLLFLSWKMKAPAFAEFTREGFMQVLPCVGVHVHVCVHFRMRFFFRFFFRGERNTALRVCSVLLEEVMVAGGYHSGLNTKKGQQKERNACIVYVSLVCAPLERTRCILFTEMQLVELCHTEERHAVEFSRKKQIVNTSSHIFDMVSWSVRDAMRCNVTARKISWKRNPDF
jgi:hypothetical protein